MCDFLNRSTTQPQKTQLARIEHELASLPLDAWHREQLTSSFADLGNVSMGDGTVEQVLWLLFRLFLGKDVKMGAHGFIGLIPTPQ